MITCLSSQGMWDFIQILGDGMITRVGDLILVNAETGTVVWKWNDTAQLFCRVAETLS